MTTEPTPELEAIASAVYHAEGWGDSSDGCSEWSLCQAAVLAGWNARAAQPRQLTDAKLFEMYDKAMDEEVTHRSAVIAFGRAIESLLVQDVPPQREATGEQALLQHPRLRLAWRLIDSLQHEVSEVRQSLALHICRYCGTLWPYTGSRAEMSDTPRTDAMRREFTLTVGGVDYIAADFADALERERDALQAENRELNDEMLRIHNEKVDHFEARIAAERKCAALQAENERLAEALRATDTMMLLMSGKLSVAAAAANIEPALMPKEREALAARFQANRKALAAARRLAQPVKG